MRGSVRDLAFQAAQKCHTSKGATYQSIIEQAILQAVEQERERCAQVIEAELALLRKYDSGHTLSGERGALVTVRNAIRAKSSPVGRS